jgi:hypothetical protein
MPNFQHSITAHAILMALSTAGLLLLSWGCNKAETRRANNQTELKAEPASIPNGQSGLQQTAQMEDSRAAAAKLPALGTCYHTRVQELTNRFGGNNPSDDSGSAILFQNGLYQVDYDVVPGIVHSRSGDRVTMCVIDLPRNCPPGDLRGVIYRTRNLRTGDEWELPDSQHGCGGP